MRPFPLSWRLGLFYAALFGAIGVQLPFWPLYLASKGLGPADIGALVAATYLARVASNPLAGCLVDRLGEHRRPLMVLAVIGAAATACFALVDGFWPMMAITVLAFGSITAMLPLADNLTLLCVTRDHLDYGRIRLWGSLAFISVAGLGGAFLVGAPPSAILWASVATALLALAAALPLPEGVSLPASKQAKRPFGRLLKSPEFRLFLVSTSFIQLSHVIYYGFATLHWHAAGLSGLTIGALWAEGVIAEVVLFAVGARLVARLGPVRLIAIGALAALVRWTVLGLSTDPAMLAAVQWLHAFTFGATHLGAMHFINRAVPGEISATSLGLYSSVTLGVVPGLALLGAGRLYQAWGGGAFLAMTVAAAMGFGLTMILAKTWQGNLVVEEVR